MGLSISQIMSVLTAQSTGITRLSGIAVDYAQAAGVIIAFMRQLVHQVYPSNVNTCAKIHGILTGSGGRRIFTGSTALRTRDALVAGTAAAAPAVLPNG